MTASTATAAAAPLGEVVNTRIKASSRTKASQGKGWNSVLNVAKRFYKSRPEDHLASLLVELRELNISRKDPGRYYKIKDVVQPVGESIMRVNNIDLDDDFFYPNVTGDKYSISNVSPVRYLSTLIRPDTTGIMELGSGWGSNLFQLYLARGATRSKRVIYYGGEYTPEGQICSKYIASKDDAINFRSFRFDFREPNVTFLKRQRGHILLFSVHAIEQVYEINPILFEQLAEIANEITVVHFEPVGWQRDPDLKRRRMENDREFFEESGRKALEGNIDSVIRNSAWWSWRLDYNHNLLSIIDELQDRGLIKIHRKTFDFDGSANVLNPTSLIHYDFVR